MRVKGQPEPVISLRVTAKLEAQAPVAVIVGATGMASQLTVMSAGIAEITAGSLLFTVIIFVRLGANLYTNNVLKFTPEQYESYPFRIP